MGLLCTYSNILIKCAINNSSPADSSGVETTACQRPHVSLLCLSFLVFSFPERSRVPAWTFFSLHVADINIWWLSLHTMAARYPGSVHSGVGHGHSTFFCGFYNSFILSDLVKNPHDAWCRKGHFERFVSLSSCDRLWGKRIIPEAIIVVASVFKEFVNRGTVFKKHFIQWKPFFPPSLSCSLYACPSNNPLWHPHLGSCFCRKNASRSWHGRNLTASRTHTMMRFLPHHPTLLSRPDAAGEGSVPRSTLKRTLSATCARSALEDVKTHTGTYG